MSHQIIPDNNGKTYKTHKPNYKAQMFASFYLSPTSETFMNVRASAIRAGYSELYSNNITVQQPKWWLELVASAEFERAKMLATAQKRLCERLEEETDDRDRIKVQTDVAKFVSERLGKDFFSTRQEVTGAGGRKLFDDTKRETAKLPLQKLFKSTVEKAWIAYNTQHIARTVHNTVRFSRFAGMYSDKKALFIAVYFD